MLCVILYPSRVFFFQEPTPAPDGATVPPVVSAPTIQEENPEKPWGSDDDDAEQTEGDDEEEEGGDTVRLDGFNFVPSNTDLQAEVQQEGG